jgi:hypothetical protein
MDKKVSTTIPGTVEKIIKSPSPSKPDLAQIAVVTADHAHNDIFIENALQDEGGNETSLEPGAKVEVTVTAEPEPVRFGRW